MIFSWAVSREARRAASLSFLLVTGCACLKDAPPAAEAVSKPNVGLPANSVTNPEPATVAARGPLAAPSPPSPVPPLHPPTPAAGPQPAIPKGVSNAAAANNVATAKSQPSASTAPAPTPVPKAVVAAAPTTVAKAAPTPSPAPVPKSAAAPVATRPTTPPLDLKSLETRLRETKAVGVFTKLSLKNQVDDLLAQVRAYHKSQSPPLAALRQSYNLLMLKVLALLQDSDPTLARDIVASREAIWGILADPKKFTESNLMAGVLP